MIVTDTYGYRPEDVCVLKDDPDPDFPEHSQPTRANIVRDNQVITILQSVLTCKCRFASWKI
jgi:hypothetical protein